MCVCVCVCAFSAAPSPLLHGFGWSVLQSVHHVDLEQLLVADTHLHRMGAGAVLTVPDTERTALLRTRLLSGHSGSYLSLHVNVTTSLPSPPLPSPPNTLTMS